MLFLCVLFLVDIHTVQYIVEYLFTRYLATVSHSQLSRVSRSRCVACALARPLCELCALLST